MTRTSVALLWLTVFTAFAAVCALVVVATLRNPVPGALTRYSATFTDVSGLFVGNDVRISGVQVGKVTAVRLDGRNATVDFNVQHDRPLFDTTVAAVRYQNLLGQRYVELIQPTEPGRPLSPEANISLGHTVPSFDVAKLFNGFRPIFQTLDPAQFNQLGQNLLRLIQGDDTGIGPVLRDLDALSSFAIDRQALFVTVIRNLGEVSRDLGGKSRQLFDLITTLNGVLLQFTAKVEQFRTSVDDGLPPLRNLVRLLQYAERTFDGATTPTYDLLSRMFPQTPTIIAGLSLVPSLAQGLRDFVVDDKPATPTFTCSHGVVTLPGIGEVSFAQQNLVLCQ